MEMSAPGTHGPWVAFLQSMLNKAYGQNLVVDGVFGPATQAAVETMRLLEGAPGGSAASVWDILAPAIAGVTPHAVTAADTLDSLAQAHDIHPALIVAANPGVDFTARLSGTVRLPQRWSVVNADLPYTWRVMQLNLMALKRRYPFIKIFSAGKSVLGRTLYGVRVGDGEHRVAYNAAHHANEWINTPMLMIFIETLCKTAVLQGRIEGYTVGNLLSTHRYDIIPMVNPDGVDLVTGGIGPVRGSEPMSGEPLISDNPMLDCDLMANNITSDNDFYHFAKAACARDGIPFPGGWKANAHGVDLNLQYPAGWESARDIKAQMGITRPAPRDYVGPAPLCEPESQAMAAFTKAGDYRLTLSHHSQGREIYWKFGEHNPPLSELIGKFFASLSGYTLSTTPPESGNAGYKDWFIQEYNRPAYTVETGQGCCPLDTAQLAEITQENMGVLLLGGLV